MKTLNVLFDHQAFATQSYGGVSRYFIELARALRTQPNVRARLFVPAHISTYIAAGDPVFPLSFRLPWPDRGLKYRAATLTPLLSVALQLVRPQILHETAHGQVEARVPRATRVVTTLHDMTVERYPQWFDRAERRMADKLAALRRADAIICISAHTLRDLLDRYPEFGSRCTVVHHGVTLPKAGGTVTQVLPSRYLLYVGTRRTYKNFLPLLRALGEARRLPPSLQLLCFGGGPLDAAERALCAEVGWHEPRVIQIDGDDALLAEAYHRAELFIFPSLYEGFGMPLTEAMVQGCPIACSHASSFPEVCGDAAAYFDAEDPYDMAMCIESIILDSTRRQALAEAASRRGKSFSWHRCAEQTLQVYKRVLAAEAQR